VASYNCAEARASVVQIQPSGAWDGTWVDVDGTTFTDYAYHYQKGAGPFASGGPLVEVGTRVWLWLATTRGDGTPIYAFDCPAGFTGLETVMTDWQCSAGVGLKTIKYGQMHNGQQVRIMTLEPPTGSICF
jgi:hypothetical protein